MGNLLKDAFNQVRADEELKSKTEQHVLEKAGRKSEVFKFRYLKAVATTCICFFFLLAFGNWFYFTPTSEINVDINPSIGLGINRFNDVVSVEGLNEDGLELSNKLNLKYENYEDALSQLLSSETIEALLAQGNKVVITVTGDNAEQTSQIVTQIEVHSSEYGNASCHEVSSDEAKEAHELGLSYGKYKAYLQLKELDSSFTPEELQGMTMSEIQELIDKLLTTQGVDADQVLDQDTNEVVTEEDMQTTDSVQDNASGLQNSNGQREHHATEHGAHHE